MPTPPNNFKKTNVPKEFKGHLVQFPILNQAQLDAFAGLMARFRPEKQASLFQTWTETGGLHTYVKLPDGDEYHIARNGNMLRMGVVGSELQVAVTHQLHGVRATARPAE